MATQPELIELYRSVDTYNSEFSHDASDKMQMLGMGELPPPAQCFVCGNGSCEAGYLTFGIWAEFIGNLLICAPCLTQGAEVIGCLAPSVNVLLQDAVTKLQDAHKTVSVELEVANERLNAYRTIANAGFANSNFSADDIVDTEIKLKNSDASSSVPDSTDEQSERKITRSSGKQRRDDVPLSTEPLKL